MLRAPSKWSRAKRFSSREDAFRARPGVEALEQRDLMSAGGLPAAPLPAPTLLADHPVYAAQPAPVLGGAAPAEVKLSPAAPVGKGATPASALIGPAAAGPAVQMTPYFDTSRYPQERRVIDAQRESNGAKSFPYLGFYYEVDAPSTRAYNCIAWSLGITNQWINPRSTLAGMDQLNGQFGYRRMSGMDLSLQRGVEKIVLFGNFVNGQMVYTHQARQLADGSWTSKLGGLAQIRHLSPYSLAGPAYGYPVAVYYRVRR
jgi:hypothetical protein